MHQSLEQMMTKKSCESVMQRFHEEMVLDATGTADPGRTVSFQTEEYCKDGSTILMENSAVLLRDADGRPTGILGISRDITERKRAEERIRWLASFPELNPNPVIEMDEEGTITFANAATYNTLRDLGLPENPAAFVPEDKEDILRLLRETGESQLYREITLNNNIFAEDITLNRELNVVRIYTRNITERKRSEVALQLKDFAIESSINAIAIADLSGNLTDVNPAFLSMWGYEHRQEVIGRSVLSFWKVPDEAQQVVDGIQVKGTWSGEMTGQRKDGIPVPVQLLANLIRDATGKPVAMMSSFIDITERKRAEETIRHTLAEKEVLLQEIHHRVKNNLAGIIALINLQTSSFTDPAFIFQFKDLETRIRSMALVHESLCLTKDLAQIDVANYTDNLTRHLIAVYGDDPKIRCRIGMGDITMSIDTAMPCGLVMTEIVTNSLKYAFPDTFSCEEIRGEPCTISITMQREGSDYLLTVADNGIGIQPGINVTMASSLGLYLIGFIVEHQLQGTLEISTTGGTAYTIRFPEPETKERKPDE
jgi:PAS domain S-box-containing protein